MLNNYSPVVRLRKYAAAAKWIQRQRTMEKTAQPGPGVAQYRAYHGPAAANQFKPGPGVAGATQLSLAGRTNNFAQNTRTGTPNQRSVQNKGSKYADNSHVINAGPNSRHAVAESIQDPRNPRLAPEERRMTDRERNMRAWQQQGYNSTRWYQPGDWLRGGLGRWGAPWMYNMAFPMPDNYRAPREF